MKHLKKLLAFSMAFALTTLAAGCGDQAQTTAPSSDAASETASAEASGDTVTVKVGASPAPHAEILEAIKPILAEQGVNLEIQEFTDYVLPNKALDAGDIDANYFQHLPFLEKFNKENDTDLVSAAAIHFEPLGVYAGKTDSIEALPDGATIAVSNDPTNEARALLLLQKLGLIKMEENAGLDSTPLNIVENPKNIKFEEIEAALAPSILPDVDLAVINGNYAISAGIQNKVLTTEDKESEAAKEFANIIAVRAGDENRPEIQKLVAALQSEEVTKLINEKYEGAVIPTF